MTSVSDLRRVPGALLLRDAARPSRPPRQFNSPQLYGLDEVFIGNLPYRCTEEDLRALCLPSGQVVSCTFHRRENGQPKGSAFVRFADVDGAEHLFQRGKIGEGLHMQGRRLTIDGHKRRNAKLVDKDSQVGLNKIEVGYWAQRDVFVPCWSRDGGNAQFDFGHHRIVVRFGDSAPELCEIIDIFVQYTTTMRFKSIREVARDEFDGLITALYIDLKSPPRVEHGWELTAHSERCTELPAAEGDVLGTCLVWRLVLGADGLRPASSLPERLSHQQFYDPEEYRDIQVRRDDTQRNCLDKESLKSLAAGIDDRLCYALECLVSAGYVREENLSNELFAYLRAGDVNVCERALYRMWGAERRIYDPTKALRKAVAQVKRVREQRDLPAHCLQTRNALVTPTRVLFFPPVPEQSNRVLRYWERNKQLGRYFLRVSFVDEEFGQLFLLNGQAGKGVQARIDNTLSVGIVSPLSGLHYEFMAYSSSQLREGSCWFFSSDNPSRTTVIDIVSWMGDFSDNKVVAKYAARIGQCFSSSKIGVTHVPLEQMSHIPDVERNGYTFSDGVGRISRPLAVKIQDALKLKSLPSAFQIRFAGDKGVVTVDPEVSGVAQSEHLWWRDSMRKFKSDHNVLEVLSYSKYLPGHLNLQIIAVMSTHGVPNDAFLSLQAEQVTALDRMVESYSGAKAVLSQQGSPLYSRLHQLMKAGLTVDEPFVHNCLQVLRQRQLVDLKTKARIAVPQARTLIGVMDEAAVLEYGQVFFQYTNPPSAKSEEPPRIHQGWVVVAKCPVLHPGDVRMLMAVDRPELHHVVDCLVFPQKGERPHPNELAGSDLDGDLYFVSWDASLFLPDNANYPAMDYSGPEVEKVDFITQRDIVQFFSKFIQNNCVGVIANAHKVHADASPDGVKDPACIKLARLHSMAVDFNKTGVPAELPAELRVRNSPDFMGKKDSSSYVSTKVLGELYRRVHLEKQLILIDTLDRIELNEEFLVPGFMQFVEEAQETKQRYDLELTEIMNQHSVQTEAEAVTGNVMKMRGQFKKGKKWFNLHQQLQPLTEHLWAKYRRVFDEQLSAAVATATAATDGNQARDAGDDDETERLRQQKAAAWYYVSYCAPPHEDEEDEGKDDGGGARRGRRRRRRNRNKKRRPLLLSFAWVMHDVMGSVIKQRVGQRVPASDSAQA